MWYTRDGDLDFLAPLSKKVLGFDQNIKSCYICHKNSEAVRLQTDFGIQATVLSRKINLGKNLEKEINYEALQELQKRYPSISLRSSIYSEIFENGQSDLDNSFQLIQYFKFWEKYLSENDIQIVVSEYPAIMPTNVLWIICQQRNINFYAFNLCGIDGRTQITSSWDHDLDAVKEILPSLKVDRKSVGYAFASQYLEAYLKSPEKPKFYNLNNVTGEVIDIENGELWVKPDKIFHKFSVWKILKRLFNGSSDRWIYDTSKWTRFLRWFQAKRRIYHHKLFNIFETDLDLKNNKYFVLGLSMLNEYGLYYSSGIRYIYPLDTIREIALALPLGTKLYVKEHVAFFPQRPFSFYRELKKIPNVVIVDRRENVFELMQNSLGVITFGGTMGWEAYLLGIPVVTLTKCWYSAFAKVYSMEHGGKLDKILMLPGNMEHAEKEERIKAIYALFETGVDALLYPYPVLLSDNNLESIAQFLLKRIIRAELQNS
jgi:hypothetical protein